MAPINDIPDDVLGEIFARKLPGACELALSTACSHPFGSLESPALPRLARKKWREVVVNYSLLWASARVCHCQNSWSNRGALVSRLGASRRSAKARSLEFHVISHIRVDGLPAMLPPPPYLRTVAYSRTSLLISPTTIFENSSLLRRIALGCVSADDYFPTIILPWQQLTHFIILFDVTYRLLS